MGTVAPRHLATAARLSEYAAQADELWRAWRAGTPWALELLHQRHPRFLDEKTPWLPKRLTADDIRGALTAWTEDFNARRADKICDLFAPHLIADFRGRPERGYEEVCRFLKSSLVDGSFSYALDIGLRAIGPARPWHAGCS